MAARRLYSRVHGFLQNDSDGGLFYGWRLVVLGTVIVLVGREVGASLLQQWFISAAPQENFWSASLWLYPALFWAISVFGFLVLPVAGWGVDRYGSRRMAQIGLPLTGIFILLTTLRAPGFSAVFVAGIGAAGLLGSYLPTVASLNNWFRSRLVIALAAALFAVAVGE